ncbi:hypothetical protein WDV76_02835 [Xenorhabdus griffiniae]|uniref:hypothetical protein n=1 Tax=Xenorhabdus griffiniae TaxID=351672 RepID=UPI0030D1FF89
MNKIISFVFLLMFSGIANAMWVTQSNENIFNEKKSLMLGQLSGSSSVVAFDCEDGELSISYLEDDKETDMDGMPMELMIKIDSNPIIKFSAITERRNSNSMGITSGDKNGIIKVLSQLRNASSKFLVGVIISGTDGKISRSGNVNGSTKAVNKFISDCGIKID